MKILRTAMIFAVALLLVLASCSSGEPVSEGFDKDYDTSYELDFSGMDFSILQNSQISEEQFYYDTDTLLSDYSVKRMNSVAADHKCSISLKYIASDDTLKSLLQSYVISCDYYADIAFVQARYMRDTGNVGGLYDITAFTDVIDISDYDKWGEPNTWEFMMCKGNLYGVVPCAWIEMKPYAFYPIAFNTELTKRFGYGDLRELYENGKWTRDSMLEIMVACTDNNLATPVKGMAACLKHFIRAALLANNTEFCVFNDDLTEYHCGWEDEAGIEALEWVQSVGHNYTEYMNGFPSSSIEDWSYTNYFCDGESTMILTSLVQLYQKICYEVDDFGIMPFPNGPYGEPGKWTGFYEAANVLAIPVTAKDSGASAILMNEIFDFMEEYPDQNAITNYYVTRFYSDPRDMDIINKMSSNCKYSFWPDGGDIVLNNIYTSLMSSSPVEILEAHGNKSDECIIEQMIPSIIKVNELKELYHR